MSNCDVKVGDIVYFIVKIMGILELEVMWYKYGELLKEDLWVKFIKDFYIRNYLLLINKVIVEDEGEYCCVVFNMGGLVVC